jgi:hypothetical protein
MGNLRKGLAVTAIAATAAVSVAVSGGKTAHASAQNPPPPIGSCQELAHGTRTFAFGPNIVTVALYLYGALADNEDTTCWNMQEVVSVTSGSGVFGSKTQNSLLSELDYGFDGGQLNYGYLLQLPDKVNWPRAEISWQNGDTEYPFGNGGDECLQTDDYWNLNGSNYPAYVWNNTNTREYQLPEFSESFCF